ncbi:MAG: deoxynucleoside kinase [Rubricoccaceae bacterium]|nr:deoxynucleoside kinase [Rubricoccaceae bacterium]
MQTDLDLADAPAATPDRRPTYVAIAGNIGAGKSSLTTVLADYFGWEPYFERVDDNPYLSDFYADMRRWSFNLQVFFLSSRFRHQKAIEAAAGAVVQDRSIYEDVEIFARNLHEMDLMDTRDFENYCALFDIMAGYLRPPDLLVYLRASVPTLVRQIQARGRDFEAGNRIDDLDFVQVHEDRFEIVSRVESRLYGLFPERV